MVHRSYSYPTSPRSFWLEYAKIAGGTGPCSRLVQVRRRVKLWTWWKLSKRKMAFIAFAFAVYEVQRRSSGTTNGFFPPTRSLSQEHQDDGINLATRNSGHPGRHVWLPVPLTTSCHHRGSWPHHYLIYESQNTSQNIRAVRIVVRPSLMLQYASKLPQELLPSSFGI